MNVHKFTRKSFPVEGVQVTADNMAEVAQWCDGDIRTEDGVPFIKVRVHNPINERQTKAFVNDWVLYAGKGYKVYKDAAFGKSFDRSSNPGADEFARNVFQEETPNPVAGVSGGTAQPVNPGGTTSV